MLNIAAIQGRLTADPEMRQTPAGVPVVTVTLACERSYAPKGQERQTDFIPVVAWRGTAEVICRYIRKGQLVAVNGSLQTRKYTDKSGNNRTAFEIVADGVHFCEKKSADVSGVPVSASPMTFSAGNTADFVEMYIDNDLPFS